MPATKGGPVRWRRSVPRGPADEANEVSSPRVPVAISNEAASRIATVSAAVTMMTGVFILARSRRRPPRVVAQKLAMAWKKQFESGRNRHRHGDLDRKRREGDDQAQRQRADRERSRDGVGQSGRGDRRGAATKAQSAGRPDHGRNPA